MHSGHPRNPTYKQQELTPQNVCMYFSCVHMCVHAYTHTHRNNNQIKKAINLKTGENEMGWKEKWKGSECNSISIKNILKYKNGLRIGLH